VVTVAYLRRFVCSGGRNWPTEAAFRVQWLTDPLDAVQVILAAGQSQWRTALPEARRAVMDALGAAATAYRSRIYRNSLPAEQAELTGQKLGDFLALAQAHLDHTSRANRRQTLYPITSYVYSTAPLTLFDAGGQGILSSVCSPDEALLRACAGRLVS
jgi:hypothetical protein